LPSSSLPKRPPPPSGGHRPGRRPGLPGAPPAYGVAVLGAVIRADRPEQVLAGLLYALGESG